MKCPCGSGLAMRRSPQGTPWCPMCASPATARGRMRIGDLDMSRERITANAAARREIEARRDLQVLDAYE